MVIIVYNPGCLMDVKYVTDSSYMISTILDTTFMTDATQVFQPPGPAVIMLVFPSTIRLPGDGVRSDTGLRIFDLRHRLFRWYNSYFPEKTCLHFKKMKKNA